MSQTSETTLLSEPKLNKFTDPGLCRPRPLTRMTHSGRRVYPVTRPYHLSVRVDSASLSRGGGTPESRESRGVHRGGGVLRGVHRRGGGLRGVVPPLETLGRLHRRPKTLFRRVLPGGPLVVRSAKGRRSSVSCSGVRRVIDPRSGKK